MRKRRLFRYLTFGLLVLAVGVLQFRQVGRLLREESRSMPAPNDPAPELKAPGADGNIRDLSEMKGQIVIVSFWASWCGPCRVEMPELASFANDWNSDPDRQRDLAYLAVNVQEDPEDLNEILRDPRFRKVLFVFDRDGKNAEHWGVEGYPTTYLVSPDGKVLDSMVGYEPLLRLRLDSLGRTFRRKDRKSSTEED